MIGEGFLIIVKFGLYGGILLFFELRIIVGILLFCFGGFVLVEVVFFGFIIFDIIEFFGVVIGVVICVMVVVGWIIFIFLVGFFLGIFIVDFKNE